MKWKYMYMAMDIQLNLFVCLFVFPGVKQCETYAIYAHDISVYLPSSTH